MTRGNKIIFGRGDLDHENRSSKQMNDILKFEKLAKSRFCVDLTNEKSCNSLNFKVEGSSFGFTLPFVIS